MKPQTRKDKIIGILAAIWGIGSFLFILLGFLFACLLRRSERSAKGHGLEFPSGRRPLPPPLTGGGYR